MHACSNVTTERMMITRLESTKVHRVIGYLASLYKKLEWNIAIVSFTRMRKDILLLNL